MKTIEEKLKERSENLGSVLTCGNCYYFRPTGKVFTGKYGYKEGTCRNRQSLDDEEDIEYTYVGDIEYCQDHCLPQEAWWETPDGKKHLEAEMNRPSELECFKPNSVIGGKDCEG